MGYVPPHSEEMMNNASFVDLQPGPVGVGLFFLILSRWKSGDDRKLSVAFEKVEFPCVFDILVKGDEPVKLPGFLLCKLCKLLKMLLLSI